MLKKNLKSLFNIEFESSNGLLSICLGCNVEVGKVEVYDHLWSHLILLFLLLVLWLCYFSC